MEEKKQFPTGKVLSVRIEREDGVISLDAKGAEQWKEMTHAQASSAWVHGLHFSPLPWKVEMWGEQVEVAGGSWGCEARYKLGIARGTLAGLVELIADLGDPGEPDLAAELDIAREALEESAMPRQCPKWAQAFAEMLERQIDHYESVLTVCEHAILTDAVGILRAAATRPPPKD